MEEQKENNQLDFWLVQYQRLLDSKPERLVERVSSNRTVEHIHKMFTTAQIIVSLIPLFIYQ